MRRGQRPGRDGGGGEDARAWLVQGRRGVLGQAHVAHQHGDLGGGRGLARRPGQRQGLGVVVVGHEHVVGVAGVFANRPRPLSLRPGQGDVAKAGRAERRRAEPERAAAGLPCGLEGGQRQRRAADHHHRLLGPARQGAGQVLMQQGRQGQQAGEDHPGAGPAPDAEAPVLQRLAVRVGIAVDVEQRHRPVERLVERNVVAGPAPKAKTQRQDRRSRDQPGQPEAEESPVFVHRQAAPAVICAGNGPARLSAEIGGLPIFSPIQRPVSISAARSKPVSKPPRSSM